MRGVLVAAVICLVVGLGVFFGYCHGTTGVQFSSQLSATSIHLDITTAGLPAIVGLALTVLGAFLLVVATVIALATMRRTNGGNGGPIKHRESAFEE